MINDNVELCPIKNILRTVTLNADVDGLNYTIDPSHLEWCNNWLRDTVEGLENGTISNSSLQPRNVNSKPQVNNTEIASKKRKSPSDLPVEGVSDNDLLNQVPPEKALSQEEATKGAFVLARTTANSSTWNEAQIYEVLENGNYRLTWESRDYKPGTNNYDTIVTTLDNLQKRPTGRTRKKSKHTTS